MCGTLQIVCQDIDCAELFAFNCALQHCAPGGIFYTDSGFVRDGVYQRGKAYCWLARAAWSELWVQ
eukprot:8029993-Pyramimonas_sp.AAC.1